MLAMTRRALRHYATLGLLACAATWGPMASAQTLGTPVVVVNSLPVDGPGAYQFSGTEQRGPAFQTGTVATRITEVAFGFYLEALPTTATLSLYQLDNATNAPAGAPLASVTINMIGTGAATDVHVYNAGQLGAIATTTLQPGQKYALILSNASDAAGLTDGDTDPAYSLTYTQGFSAVGSGVIDSDDSGATWTSEPTVPAFRLTVAPLDVVVPPVAAATPVPTLGAVGLVSLVSVMGFIGLRRSRKSV